MPSAAELLDAWDAESTAESTSASSTESAMPSAAELLDAWDAESTSATPTGSASALLDEWDADLEGRERSRRRADLMDELLAAREPETTLEKSVASLPLDIASGLALAGKAVGGVISGAARAYDEVPFLPPSLLSIPAVRRLASQQGAQAQEVWGDIAQENVEQQALLNQGATGETISDVTRTAAASAPSLVVAPLGLPAAAGAAGLQSFGSAFGAATEGYERGGLGREEAEKAALAPAAISGAITAALTGVFGRTGIEALAARDALRTVGEKALTRIAKSALKNYFSEAAEEGLDQAAQSLVEEMSYNPELTLPEAVERSVQAALAGGVLGAGAGALQAGLPSTRAESQLEADLSRGAALTPEQLAMADLAARNLSMPGAGAKEQVLWAPPEVEMPAEMVQWKGPVFERQGIFAGPVPEGAIRWTEPRALEEPITGTLPQSGQEFVSVGDKPGFLQTAEERIIRRPVLGQGKEPLRIVPEAPVGAPVPAVQELLDAALEQRDLQAAVNLIASQPAQMGRALLDRSLGVGRTGTPLSAAERTLFNELWEQEVRRMQAVRQAEAVGLTQAAGAARQKISRQRRGQVAAAEPEPGRSGAEGAAPAPALPPVPAGMIRLFQGKGPESGGGSFWSANPARAATYGPEVSYVDVTPEEAAAAAEARRKAGSGTSADYVLPPGIARRARVLEQPVEQEVHDLEAATEKGEQQDASTIRETTKVHGDVRQQPIEGQGQMPAEESGGGVQPQAEGGIPEAGPSDEQVLLNRAAAAAPAEFTKMPEWKQPGGLTGAAVRAGDTITSKEQLADLRAKRAAAEAEFAAARQRGDFDAMQGAGMKRQFFNEAIESAVGLKTMEQKAALTQEEYDRRMAADVPAAAEGTPRPADAGPEAAAGTPAAAKVEQGPAAARAREIAERLRAQFKTPVSRTELGTFGLVPKVINAAVEVAARVIEAGGTVIDAINEAVAYIRKQHSGYFDEAGFRAHLQRAVQPAAPQQAVPDTQGESTKMRKSAERAITSPMIPPPVQERIAEAPESRYRQQSMRRVEEAVSAMTDAELGAVPRDSDLYTAARLEQADRLFRAGNNEAGYRVFAELEKEGTRFGQLINQFKLLAGSRPENIVRVLNEKLARAGRDRLTEAQEAKALALARESKAADAALDDATAAWQADPSDANAAAADAALDLANERSLDLQRFVHRMQPRTTAGLLKSILQGNLLTPISEVANLVGNVSFLPFRAATRGGAAFLDTMDAFLRGRPREVAAQPLRGTAEAARGAWRGIKQIPSIALRGTGETIKGEARTGLHPLRAWVNQFARNPEMPTRKGRLTLGDRVNLLLEGTFGLPAEIMLRGLGAGDAPFRQAAEARVIAEQLRLKNVPRKDWSMAQKFPELFFDPETMEQIRNDAAAAIFQGRSTSLEAINRMIRHNWLTQRGVSPDLVDFAVATVAPYKLTPWKITGEILSYNPIVALGRTILESKAGNTRAAKLNASKMVVGSLLVGAAYWLYEKGLLAPSMDQRDEAQKARVLAGEVLPPNHINVSGLKRALRGEDPAYRAGDETVDVFRAGGLAGAMMYLVANTGRDFERRPEAAPGELVSSILRQSTLEQARFAMNQSYLSGVEGLLTAIKDGNADNYLRQWMNTLASLPLPNTLGTLSRALRERRPDFRSEKFSEQVENIVRNRLGFAGLDDYLPLRRGLWGEPLPETPKNRNAFFYHFFDISKNRQVTDDAVALELYRLWRKTGRSEVIPSLPEREITVQNQTFQLEPELHSRYAELVGKERRRLAEWVVTNPNFHRMTDEAKVKLLDRVYRQGMDRGKLLFWREHGTNLTAKAPKAGFR